MSPNALYSRSVTIVFVNDGGLPCCICSLVFSFQIRFLLDCLREELRRSDIITTGFEENLQ
ncbi:hypothetical protein D3C80_2077310 [compost metagenome]